MSSTASRRIKKAFTVCLHIRSVDGAPHAGAEGRLVSLTPITNAPKILMLPDVTPGLLQWGAFGSGKDRSTITRGGVLLDVIVLENSDSLGKAVYFNDTLRDRSRIYLDLAPWRAVVEVTSDDGTSAEVTFDIFKGEQGNSPHIISSSPAGTLYGPRVEIVSSPR